MTLGRQLSNSDFDEHGPAQPRTRVATEQFSPNSDENVKPKPLNMHQTNSLHVRRLYGQNR